MEVSKGRTMWLDRKRSVCGNEPMSAAAPPGRILWSLPAPTPDHMKGKSVVRMTTTPGNMVAWNKQRGGVDGRGGRARRLSPILCHCAVHLEYDACSASMTE